MPFYLNNVSGVPVEAVGSRHCQRVFHLLNCFKHLREHKITLFSFVGLQINQIHCHLAWKKVTVNTSSWLGRSLAALCQ
jgi:hypothetical protein